MLGVSDLSMSEATEEVQVELADNKNKKKAYPWKDDQIFTLIRFWRDENILYNVY